MKKVLTFILVGLLLLAACSGPKTTGKRVVEPDTDRSPLTGMVTGSSDSSQPQAAPAEPPKSAAEVLNEMKSAPSGTAPATDTAPKSGNFYPQIVVNGTGKVALAEKTRALFSQNISAPTVKADTSTGMNGGKYHDSKGDLTNLPDKYSSTN